MIASSIAQPGLALKELQGRPTKRLVFSTDCQITATREDADGERLHLDIQVPLGKDDTKTLQLGSVHVGTSAEQLDHVIAGAVLACRTLDVEAGLEARRETKQTVLAELRERFEGTSPKRRIVLPPPDAFPEDRPATAFSWTGDFGVHSSFVMSLIEPIGARAGENSIHDLGNLGVAQMPSLRQWHQNTCGYHALYNVAIMLLSKSRKDFEIAANDESQFWCFVFRALARLQKQRERQGIWKSAKLEKAILDVVHIEYLIQTDPYLKHRVKVIESVEELKIELEQMNHTNVRAFILGCSSHWIALGVIDNGTLAFMDSFNKPLLDVTNEEASYNLACQTVEAYREGFRAKLRQVWRYEHYPDEVLDRLYDEGVPEYWKGQLKEKLWWHHRPVSIRINIMLEELECIRGYLNIAKDFLNIDMDERALTNQILPRSIPRRSNPHFPGVHTNLTNEVIEFAGYVRRDEALPANEIDRNMPATVENRKRPPLSEVPGDAFDRQRVIPGFDQALIERQMCLVIGTGGIGMNVALTLARLGVNEIIMVDYDVYDASNLTRQCLGSRSDVGLKKTQVAAHNIQAHNLRSKVHVLDANIIHNWAQVVHEARRCTAIFNCCDAGLMVDFAINSLSKEFAIPLCSGQSFAWKFMSEFYSGHPGRNCAFCQETTRSSFSCDHGESVWNRLSKFTGNSNEVSAQDFDSFLSRDAYFRISSGAFLELKEMSPALQSLFPLRNSRDVSDLLERYHDCAINVMLPGKISKCQNLNFIPRPTTPKTRFFGSWVCPCLACGVINVSHWSQYLTADNKRDPPTTILFNMDEGMTADEQMAYECGMVLDKANRSFVSTPSSTECKVCKAALALERHREVMLGKNSVNLVPVPGAETCLNPSWEWPMATSTLTLRREFVQSRLRHALDTPADSRLLIPLIPAVDPKIQAPDNEPPHLSDMWPYVELGAVALIKVSAREGRRWPSSIEAIASGLRSAVAHCTRTHRSYRFKGCGNGQLGFPLEVKGDDGVSKSLRGCQFEYTAARELFMTQFIKRECGVITGNSPLGYYRYPTTMPEEFKAIDSFAWEAPEIEKFCTVFETLGEKRLGDDLLFGLEILLSQSSAVSPRLLEKAREQLQMLGRCQEDETVIDTATAAECAMDLIDITSVLSDDDELVSYIALAKRLGWECGLVMKRLAEGAVSWGTYVDAMGVHCNAHANNMVVIAFPESRSEMVDDHYCALYGPPILAAVDFDMAFNKETFIEGFWPSRSSLLPTSFDEIIMFEQTMGMRTSLAGSDFSNTGVVGNNNGMASSPVSLISRTILRDSVVLGFDSGLRGEPSASLVQGYQELVFNALAAADDFRST